MNKYKLLFLVGSSLFIGFIWGQALGPTGPHKLYWDEQERLEDAIMQNRQQDYAAPEIPTGKYDEMASVDIIRNGDDIWIVDHCTKDLIFEYNRFKKADREAWIEYEDLLEEAENK